MSVNIEALGIDRLTVGERLELIEKIWDSLPADIAPGDVPPWHMAELARRCVAAEAQPGLGKPWREVLSRLEGQS